MAFMYLIFVYIAVVGFGVAVFIYGKAEGNSLFDRAYRFVAVHLPGGLKWALATIFGPRGPAALDSAWQYVCWTSNPLVQIFYVCIVAGGYLVFVLHGYPHLPNSYAAAYHKHIGFGMFAACLTVWMMACISDPGMITKDNVQKVLAVYPVDDQIFTLGTCKTCKTLKPGRSKHCGMCNICVAKFDHHCIWINNCVGTGNHHYFILFLLFHSVICTYGASLGVVIALHLIDTRGLSTATFLDPKTGERYTATWSIIFQYLLATEGMIVFVIILCAVMGIVLFGFMLWHLNLIRLGTTSNEVAKWNGLRSYLKHVRVSGEEEAEREEAAQTLASLRNIYNQGLLRNMKQVFWHADLDKLPDPTPAGKKKEANGSDNEPAEKQDKAPTDSVPKKKKEGKKHK